MPLAEVGVKKYVFLVEHLRKTTEEQSRPGQFLPSDAEISKRFAAGDAPNGIVAHNDLCAIGVIAAAKNCGIRVPDDLAIIGADDITDAAAAVPSLTTVSPPKRDLGREVARIIKEAIENPGEKTRTQVLLHPSRVLRESTYGFKRNHGRTQKLNQCTQCAE